MLSRKLIIHIEFTVLQLAKYLLLLLLAAYVGWEIYWYKKIGLYFVKWHTHLAATGLMFGLLWAPFYLANRFYRSDKTHNYLLAATSLWGVFVVIEILFATTGIMNEYTENRFGFYQSPYTHDTLNYYNVFHVNDTFTSTAQEFKYVFPINSLGFAGGEWPIQKQRGKCRVITMGDSFTEGDGAPIDSSFPMQMQYYLDDKNLQVEILNAGVRGSDPAFAIKNLEKKLLPYKPDVVIQMLSDNDLDFDMCVRGGFERFLNDSVVKYKKPPVWEPLYAVSYISRVIFKACGYNMSYPCGDLDNQSVVAERKEQLREIFDRYEQLALQNNFQAVIVLYPMQSNYKEGRYFFDYSELKERAKASQWVKCVDVLPCYEATAVKCNLGVNAYYWRYDAHHNSLGYNMLASCIAEQLLSLGVLKPDSNIVQ